jgi:chromosome segregation ATPase
MSRIALTVLAATLALGGVALGQNAAPAGAKPDAGTAAKDAKPGPPTQRYRFSHTAEGVLRLDNETGEVVLCRALNGGWVCNPAAQESAALKVELQRKDDQVKKLTADIAQLKGDVSKSQDAAAAGRKSLQDEVAKLQSAIAALKTDMASLTGSVTDAGKQGISQDERQSIVSRLALLEQDNSGLKGALTRLENENAALKKQLADAPKPPDLEPAVTQAITANEALKRELAATQDQLAALKKQIADPTDRNVQRAEIDRLKDENKNLTDKLASLEASNALMQNELDALKPPPPLPKAEVPSDRKDELKLPSREDMERAKAALSDAWRKLMDMIGQMQKDMLGNKDDSSVRL